MLPDSSSGFLFDEAHQLMRRKLVQEFVAKQVFNGRFELGITAMQCNFSVGFQMLAVKVLSTLFGSGTAVGLSVFGTVFIIFGEVEYR